MDPIEAVEAELERLELPADRSALDRLKAHRDLLLEWNPTAHLVSLPDAASGAALSRHYVDSVRGLLFAGETGRIIDLGSGGGFPGLIWAAFRPHRPVILVEASRRKASFLRLAARRMGLGSVDVDARHLGSAGDLPVESGDVITTRAAAAADLAVEMGRGVPDCSVVLYKGEQAASSLGDVDGYRQAGRAETGDRVSGVILHLIRA